MCYLPYLNLHEQPYGHATHEKKSSNRINNEEKYKRSEKENKNTPRAKQKATRNSQQTFASMRLTWNFPLRQNGSAYCVLWPIHFEGNYDAGTRDSHWWFPHTESHMTNFNQIFTRYSISKSGIESESQSNSLSRAFLWKNIVVKTSTFTRLMPLEVVVRFVVVNNSLEMKRLFSKLINNFAS